MTSKPQERFFLFDWTFVLCLVLGLVLFVTPSTAKVGPLFALGVLHGVDTVIVSEELGPDHVLLPLHRPTPAELKNLPDDTVTSVMKDIFSKTPWISVYSSRGVIASGLGPNTIQIDFTLSARQEISDGKPIKIGALAMQLSKYNPDISTTAVALKSVTFPFLIPDTEEKLNAKIAEGTRFLASHLPSYFTCANRYGYKTKECPECSFDSCSIASPYGERP